MQSGAHEVRFEFVPYNEDGIYLETNRFMTSGVISAACTEADLPPFDCGGNSKKPGELRLWTLARTASSLTTVTVDCRLSAGITRGL